eukprot:scaffold185791_cov26-Tisochrysis_lutea.AAC.1
MAPWANPVAPSRRMLTECRFELRLIEEALAARRVACAYRIRQLGFDETTKFGNAGITSNVIIEPTHGEPARTHPVWTLLWPTCASTAAEPFPVSSPMSPAGYLFTDRW